MAGSKPPSTHSEPSDPSRRSDEATEDTPLLSREHDDSTPTDPERPANGTTRSPAASLLLRSIQGLSSLSPSSSSKKSKWQRWPSLLALLLLLIVIILILLVAFLAPQLVKEYAAEAAQFEPTKLSVLSFSSDGVVARVQGDFKMDASLVNNKPIRDLGRFTTWIAKAVETKSTEVRVSFPEYDSPVVVTAGLPSIKVNVRNQQVTAVDFVTKLRPRSKDAIRRVAYDWLNGSLGQLRVQAKANVQVKSGIFTFPKQALTQSLVFHGKDLPKMPKYKIKQFSITEQYLPNGRTGLVAEAALKIKNDLPLDLRVPPLGFAILVPGCLPQDPYIMLADAVTSNLHVHPRRDIALGVTGFIRQLPDAVTTICPDSHKSPLDDILGKYIHGNDTTIYVRGSDSPSPDTPQWVTDIISQITVPVPFPGSQMDSLVKDFKLDNVHFDFPNPFADPHTPESKPKMSATIMALIGLPDEINFPIQVNRVKADTDLYYRKRKFAKLDLSEWRNATSKMVKDSKKHSDLEVRSEIEGAPMTITDGQVFSEVIQEILTGQDGVNLTAKAAVDVETGTVLGKLIVKDIPAEGDVPVNPLGGGDLGSFAPKVGNLQIAQTSPDSVTLDAAVNFTNPTKYSANVAFVDLKILVNDTVIGHATARNISVVSADNLNIPIRVYWDPRQGNATAGPAVAREFISQYLSGYNVSLTFKPHEGSIPSQPALGKALSSLEVTLPMPRLGTPGDGDGEGNGTTKPRFIQETTMHLFSSTATFSLLSPLTKSTIYITHLNATALYHGDNVGRILYDGSLAIPPGPSDTPPLPVEWSLASVGYDAVKKALGGTLKLAAVADVGLSIGRWHERIWYEGRGIGTHVRL